MSPTDAEFILYSCLKVLAVGYGIRVLIQFVRSM